MSKTLEGLLARADLLRRRINWHRLPKDVKKAVLTAAQTAKKMSPDEIETAQTEARVKDLFKPINQ